MTTTQMPTGPLAGPTLQITVPWINFLAPLTAVSWSSTGWQVNSKLSSTASVAAHNGTAIPAGGTAGAGVLLSSTSNFGIFFGSGAPTLSAAKGSLYLRSDGSSTSTRAYINTDGGTTWTAITTAA